MAKDSSPVLTQPKEYFVVLRERKIVLQPTVKTLRKLCTIYPSLYDLSMKCAQFNIIAICDVIQFAADGDDGKDREILEESVFEYGVQRISATIVEFIQVLFNGGKPVDKTGKPLEESKGGKA